MNAHSGSRYENMKPLVPNVFTLKLTFLPEMKFYGACQLTYREKKNDISRDNEMISFYFNVAYTWS